MANVEREMAVDWSADAYRVFKEHGVRQVAYVPDSGLAGLIELCRQDATLCAVPLTREEEGVGLLAGAWLGGDKGVLMMQSSGVGNLLNGLGSLNRACRFPLLMLITMRGEWGEANPWQVPMGQAAGALLAELGAVVHRVDHAEKVGETLAAGLQLAYESDMAVAVALTQRLLGAKEFKG